jgi:xanthine dehydrogenase small subunit
VKLREFFIAYGKQDRQPGEFVERVIVPYLPVGEKFACYKVTKRKDEDISALCGAFRVFVNDDGVVGMVRIAFGGMAATPKRAKAVEEALIGKPWTSATIEAAIPAFATDFQPLTDMRASKEYRLLAAQNLLRRFHLETTGSVERLSKAVA